MIVRIHVEAAIIKCCDNLSVLQHALIPARDDDHSALVEDPLVEIMLKVAAVNIQTCTEYRGVRRGTYYTIWKALAPSITKEPCFPPSALKKSASTGVYAGAHSSWDIVIAPINYILAVLCECVRSDTRVYPTASSYCTGSKTLNVKQLLRQSSLPL
jgi:hypothetical protein